MRAMLPRYVLVKYRSRRPEIKFAIPRNFVKVERSRHLSALIMAESNNFDSDLPVSDEVQLGK